MNYFEISKLVSDALLFLSLCWLAWRFARVPGAGINTSRIAELDMSLKSLLREADDASRHLSDQLLKRQKDLEKVLYDIETVEHRVNKAVTTAEERKGMLELSIGKAETSARTLDNQIARAERLPVSTPAPERIVQPEPRRPQAEQPAAYAPIEKEVVRMEYPEFEEYQSNQEPLEVAVEPAPEPPSFDNAPRPDLNQAPVINRAGIAGGRSLSDQIEREVAGPSRPVAQQVNNEIRGIYRAAEKALRAGQTPNSLAAPFKEKTAPAQDAHVLNDPIEISGKNQPIITTAPTQPGRDPRLGVLGGIKRQVQIL